METRGFASWLQAEIEAREWDQSELARRAGLTRGTVSRILSETREAGPEAAIAIARALSLPREEVFRRRGWLLREPETIVPAGTDPRVRRIAERLQALDVPARERTADAIDVLLDAVYSLEGEKDALLEEIRRDHPALWAAAQRRIAQRGQAPTPGKAPPRVASDVDAPAPHRES